MSVDTTGMSTDLATATLYCPDFWAAAKNVRKIQKSVHKMRTFVCPPPCHCPGFGHDAVNVTVPLPQANGRDRRGKVHGTVQGYHLQIRVWINRFNWNTRYREWSGSFCLSSKIFGLKSGQKEIQALEQVTSKTFSTK